MRKWGWDTSVPREGCLKKGKGARDQRGILSGRVTVSVHSVCALAGVQACPAGGSITAAPCGCREYAIVSADVGGHMETRMHDPVSF